MDGSEKTEYKYADWIVSPPFTLYKNLPKIVPKKSKYKIWNCKFTRKIIRKTLEVINTSNFCKTTKATLHHWDCAKLRSSHRITRLTREHTDSEETCSNYSSDLFTNQELNSNNNKANDPGKKRAKEWHFKAKRMNEIQSKMNEWMKKFSVFQYLLRIREIKIRITMRNDLIPVRMTAKSHKTKTVAEHTEKGVIIHVLMVGMQIKRAAMTNSAPQKLRQFYATTSNPSSRNVF